MTTKLRLLPYKEYKGVEKIYSVIFYYLPVFGEMYRRRVELCLDQCKSGDSILEVGFGSGLTFLNLNKRYKTIFGLDLTYDINLEHLKSAGLSPLFKKIKRVLKPGGQIIYGLPVECPFMVFMFRMLGYNICEHNFAIEFEVMQAAEKVFKKISVYAMKAFPSFFGNVYEFSHFKKAE